MSSAAVQVVPERTVTTWRYHLPNINLEGWVIAFLDSTGCLSVLSDFGDYGYRWHEGGWGPGDFREFFVRCDSGYISRKIASRAHSSLTTDLLLHGFMMHAFPRLQEAIRKQLREEHKLP